jgi:malic enzyme
MRNKGTGFTASERATLGLEGLLPSGASSPAQQARRAYEMIARKGDALDRYSALAALQDRNQDLFYRVLIDHIDDLLPVLSASTLARACSEFSHLFAHARGLWITPEHRGRIESLLANLPRRDVRLVVVTDNERVLGRGDMGAGGMLVALGRLSLHSAAAGVAPARTLPVSLDVGCDNQALLEDDLYLGWRQLRLRGERYDSLVEEFVHAVWRRFPRAVIQWEGFRTENALHLLDRYRSLGPCFNDDVQGTGVVALAAVLAAGKITGTALGEHRVLIVGAGAAGIGVARQLRAGMRSQGLGAEAVREAIAMVDVGGLLLDTNPELDAWQQSFAWSRSLAARRGIPATQRPATLEALVRAFKPTVLIGASEATGAFREGAIRAMARFVDRPVIVLLSNPSSHSEAKASDVVSWTHGRGLVAASTPVASITYAGRTVGVGEANNAFVFPGLALGATVAETREVTDAMTTVAAECLADETSADDLLDGNLFPPIARLRQVAVRIAEAVVREARDSGVGRAIADEQIPAAVRDAMWVPGDPLPS